MDLVEDKELVPTAVTQTGEVSQIVSAEMRGDGDIVFAAVQPDGDELEYAHIEVRGDHSCSSDCTGCSTSDVHVALGGWLTSDGQAAIQQSHTVCSTPQPAPAPDPTTASDLAPLWSADGAGSGIESTLLFDFQLSHLVAKVGGVCGEGYAFPIDFP
eukprot:SAG31_NODE_1291_length_8975_cov_26.197274_10_plen_157_part_00